MPASTKERPVPFRRSIPCAIQLSLKMEMQVLFNDHIVHFRDIPIATLVGPMVKPPHAECQDYHLQPPIRKFKWQFVLWLIQPIKQIMLLLVQTDMDHHSTAWFLVIVHPSNCIMEPNIRGRSIPRFGMEWIPGGFKLGIPWNWGSTY